ncbi:hypothetical protein MRBLWH7_000792 [Microbacterium sp. LWH7-1.2]|uniref:hypothetical protein n=1 Tax=Microbacterium sp. LWH7-1.2 TaxID=3135257 RepID=UPI00313917D8
MGGVPFELTTASDFVQVRLELMRYLHDPLAAIVFTRIQFRTNDDSRAWVEHDGRRWWTVTLGDLAAEMGATEKQIRRVMDDLTDRGALIRTQLQHAGPYDRRYSYSPVITEVPSGAHRVPSGADVEVPSGALVPLIKNKEEAAGGRPHPHDQNARRALTDLKKDRHLPLSIDELLAHAYSLGDGDPWQGYLVVKVKTEATITGANNPAAVLRARLKADAA